MSQFIDTTYVRQFNGTLYRLAQQRGSRFENACRRESQKSEMQFWDRIGVIDPPTTVTARHANTTYLDTPYTRRACTLQDSTCADLLDPFDDIRMKIDPTSAVMETFADTLARQVDRIWLNAYFGVALAGKTGTDSVAFDTTNQRVAASSAGLTIAKLREARRKLLAAEVGEESLYLAVTARQHDDLLGLTQVTSLDFNTKPTLVDGMVRYFMGFNIIHSELIPTLDGGAGSATNPRRCPAWAKSGMILAEGLPLRTTIDRLPQKNNNIQLWAARSVGAVRMEEVKCVEILCAEA